MFCNILHVSIYLLFVSLTSAQQCTVPDATSEVLLSPAVPSLQMQYGGSVSIWKDRLVVGCVQFDGTFTDEGQLFVYQESTLGANDWVEVASLQMEDAEQNSNLGHAVDMHENTIIGGGRKHGLFSTSGGVTIYYNFKCGGACENEWIATSGLLQNSGNGANHYFGDYVAVWGLTAAASAANNDDDCTYPACGAIYMYQCSSEGATDWYESAVIWASNKDTKTSGGGFTNGLDLFGSDEFGLELLVGEGYGVNDVTLDVHTGAVEVLHQDPNDPDLWIFDARLIASNGAANDFFGQKAQMWDGVIIVGAWGHDSFFSSGGCAYVFRESVRGARDWSEVALLEPPEANAKFGGSVSINGRSLVVGAYGQNEGVVYVYRELNAGANDWTQVAILEAEFPKANAEYGRSVRMYGDTIVMGAKASDESGSFQEGAVMTRKFSCDDCVGNWCENGATCDDVLGFNGEYSCICVDGYVGQYCEIDIDECASSPCQNGVTCQDFVNDYLCDCTGVGADGKNCETDIDDCASSPCLNEGTCTDNGLNAYLCTCDGAIGLQCENDVDDCASSPCQHGSTCTDAGLNAFACDCTDVGATGLLCETDLDDCASSPCIHGTCTDMGLNAFSCSCEAGYEGDVCQRNTDECDSSPCFNDGICNDLVNNYNCTCAMGYTDELCKTDVDDCLSSPCFNSGICSDAGANAFTCDCAGTGYEDDLCSSDVNDCLSSPCFNNGMCNDAGAHAFACNCSATGFEGEKCDMNINDCMSSPCLNNGVCSDVDLINEFQCDCSNTGFEGSICSNDVNDCVSSPCFNGGVCTDLGLHSFACNCSDMYEGALCDLVVVVSQPPCEECEPVSMSFDFTDFADGNTEQSFRADLPDMLVETLGGDVTDFNVTLVANEDGSFTVVIAFTNPEGIDVTELQDAVVDENGAIGSQVKDIKVANEAPADDNDDTDSGDEDSILPIIIVVVVVTLVAASAAVFYLYNKNAKAQAKALSLPA